MPSPALAEQIGRAQSEQMSIRRRFPFIFTNRLDVTPTEAPASAKEDMSISRLRESIQIRFRRCLAGIASRAIKAGITSVPIATSTSLADRFGHVLARDFGFNNPSSVAMWSREFTQELQIWLAALPDRQKQLPLAILALQPNDSIVLLPRQQIAQNK